MIIDLVLFVVAALAIVWGVNRHTKASTLEATLSKLRLDNMGVTELVQKEIGDLEVAVRAKIDAMAKWLRAELAPKGPAMTAVGDRGPELAVPPPNPAAPTASDAATAPPSVGSLSVPADSAAPLPPTPAPSVASGGTDADQLVAEMDAAIAKLQAKRTKIVTAQQALAEALA